MSPPNRVEPNDFTHTLTHKCPQCKSSNIQVEMKWVYIDTHSHSVYYLTLSDSSSWSRLEEQSRKTNVNFEYPSGVTNLKHNLNSWLILSNECLALQVWRSNLLYLIKCRFKLIYLEMEASKKVVERESVWENGRRNSTGSLYNKGAFLILKSWQSPS